MKSVIDIYSDMAKANPVWTAEEEKEAIEKWFKVDHERFVNEAMKHNLALVFDCVNEGFKKFDEDVFQMAVQELVKALRKYDPSRGFKISTWVLRPVQWAILRERNAYTHKGSIADELSYLNQRYNKGMSVVSVDSPIGDDEQSTVGDLISVDKVAVDYTIQRGMKTEVEVRKEVEIKDGISYLMSNLPKTLTDKEIIVIKGVLSGKNNVDLSAEMKISRMRVGQITQSAFSKIRNSRAGRFLKGLV